MPIMPSTPLRSSTLPRGDDGASVAQSALEARTYYPFALPYSMRCWRARIVIVTELLTCTHPKKMPYRPSPSIGDNTYNTAALKSTITNRSSHWRRYPALHSLFGTGTLAQLSELDLLPPHPRRTPTFWTPFRLNSNHFPKTGLSGAPQRRRSPVGGGSHPGRLLVELVSLRASEPGNRPGWSLDRADSGEHFLDDLARYHSRPLGSTVVHV